MSKKVLIDKEGLIMYHDGIMKDYIKPLQDIVGTSNDGYNAREEVNKVNDRVDEVSSQLEHIITFITPDMFDGTDYEKIQNAINYAIKNNVLLTSKSNRVYTIDDTLVINDELNIDFNNATIKMLSTKPIINVDTSNSINKYKGCIKNIILDCNNISTCALKITHAQRYHIEKITINKIKEIGIDVISGNVTKFNHIWIYNNDDNKNTTGIINRCADMVFNNIDMVNVERCVYHTGGNAFYSEVHGFINKQLYQNSVFFENDGTASVFLDRCYPDTQQIFYKINAISKMHITNNYGFWNKQDMDDDLINKYGRPYVFYFKDGNSEYSKRITFNNNTIIGCETDTKLTKLTNLKNSLIHLNSTNLFESIENLRTCSSGELEMCSPIKSTLNYYEIGSDVFRIHLEVIYNPFVNGKLQRVDGVNVAHLPTSYTSIISGEYTFLAEYGVGTNDGFRSFGFLPATIQKGSSIIRVKAPSKMFEKEEELCDISNNQNYTLRISAIIPKFGY